MNGTNKTKFHLFRKQTKIQIQSCQSPMKKKRNCSMSRKVQQKRAITAIQKSSHLVLLHPRNRTSTIESLHLNLLNNPVYLLAPNHQILSLTSYAKTKKKVKKN
jgi:hypothetical protein